MAADVYLTHEVSNTKVPPTVYDRGVGVVNICVWTANVAVVVALCRLLLSSQ